MLAKPTAEIAKSLAGTDILEPFNMNPHASFKALFPRAVFALATSASRYQFVAAEALRITVFET
jgi:hypothetical protein